MIPVLGWMAVKYLINYPRFLFLTFHLCTFENLAFSDMIGNFIKILHLTVGQYQQEGGGVGGGHPGYGDHHGCRLRPTRGLSLYMDSGFLTGS